MFIRHGILKIEYEIVHVVQVPSWKGVNSVVAGEDVKGIEATDVDEEEGEWREALSVAGKKYFWNIRTRETRWDRPS